MDIQECKTAHACTALLLLYFKFITLFSYLRPTNNITSCYNTMGTKSIWTKTYNMTKKFRLRSHALQTMLVAQLKVCMVFNCSNIAQNPLMFICVVLCSVWVKAL